MVPALALAAILCTAAAAPIAIIDEEMAALDAISLLETGTMGGLNISSLQIDGGNKESRLVFGSSDKGFTLAQTTTGTLELRHGDQLSLSVNKMGDMNVFGQLESKGAVRIDGRLLFQETPQWQIAAIENFRDGAAGWSNDSTTICGYGQNKNNDDEKKFILGGYTRFAGGETHKTFNNLPPHTHVRLTANYHMIDEWAGETAYAKLEGFVVWTDSHNQETQKEGVNICGSPAPESKFGIAIDVTSPHSCVESCSLKVSFGSTLVGSASEQSWGVSDIMIYVR